MRMRNSRRIFVSAALLVVTTGFVLSGCSEDLTSNCDVTTGICHEPGEPNDPESSSSIISNISTPAAGSSSSYSATSNPSSSAGGTTTSSSSVATGGTSSSVPLSSSVATQASSSSIAATPSSSSATASAGTGAPGDCAAPQYGKPPYGINSCLKASNGKCYTCNPDRGTECNQDWIFQLGNPSDTYWFKEVSCGSSSGGGTLVCENLPTTGTAGSSISRPTVKCDNTTLSSGLTWTGAPAWTSLVAGTYNVSVAATCGGSNKTASCGSIVVTSASSTNSLTCTGLAQTGTAGSAITQPTVRCGSTTVSSGITWSGAPSSWTSPTAGTYSITASASCSGSTQQASCGSITVSAQPSSSSNQQLTCATVSQSITVGQTPSLPNVGCGSTTLSASSVTFTPNIKNAITSAQTISNLTVSASCGGTTQTASCSGTITVTAAPSSSSGNQGGGTNDCGTACNGDVSGGSGKTTRYWDSCKPSCAWTANASQSPNGAAMTCGVSGSKLSDQNAKNACESGGSGYTCANQFPWAIDDNLAYGFAASHTNGDCGKCYLIQFTSNGEGGNSSSIIGKKMVVMISNIGGDVGGNQLDLMIPGGGVGIYNAFSGQISQNGGPSSPALGQQYGGFRATCGNDASCIRKMCTDAFGSNSSGVRGDFMKGCNWFIDWFKISNNPTFNSKQITCPPSLVSKYKH